MGQHIGVRRFDERGTTLEISEINFLDILWEVVHVKDHKKKYPQISYIDPYGNTYFNLLQRPDLVKELQKLNSKNNKEQINELIEFINNTDTHEYIVFLGD